MVAASVRETERGNAPKIFSSSQTAAYSRRSRIVSLSRALVASKRRQYAFSYRIVARRNWQRFAFGRWARRAMPLRVVAGESFVYPLSDALAQFGRGRQKRRQNAGAIEEPREAGLGASGAC